MLDKLKEKLGLVDKKKLDEALAKIKSITLDLELAEAQLVEQDKLKARILELEENPLRNTLGSINLDQMKDPLDDMSEEEREVYVATLFSNRKIFEGEVRNLMRQQIEWWAQNSLGGVFRNEAEQNAFARGNINFADLLLERLESLKQEHAQNIEDKRERAEEKKKKPTAPLTSESDFSVLNLVNKVEL